MDGCLVAAAEEPWIAPNRLASVDVCSDLLSAMIVLRLWFNENVADIDLSRFTFFCSGCSQPVRSIVAFWSNSACLVYAIEVCFLHGVVMPACR